MAKYTGMNEDERAVKLGSITNLSDARWAAGWGIHLIGFNFTPDSERYIAPSAVEEILGWLTGPLLVGEWDSGLSDVINDTVQRLGLDYVQLNEGALSQAKNIHPDTPVIYNFSLPGDFGAAAEKLSSALAGQKQPDILMLTPENPEEFAKNEKLIGLVKSMAVVNRVMLNINPDEDAILSLLEETGAQGINLTGGDEERPGLKDFDYLNSALEILLPDNNS